MDRYLKDYAAKITATAVIIAFLFSVSPLPPAMATGNLRPELSQDVANDAISDIKGNIDVNESLATAYETALGKIAEAGELTPLQLHQIVTNAVPQTATTLHQALNHPAVQTILQAKNPSVENIQTAINDASQNLSDPEKSFLSLALLGPGQGGGLITRWKLYQLTGVWGLDNQGVFANLSKEEVDRHTKTIGALHKTIEKVPFYGYNFGHAISNVVNAIRTPDEFVDIITFANRLVEKGI